MSDPGDMLDYAGAANSASYSLGKMKDSLAKIYRLLSSIQVLVCDAFHVFILVYLLLSGRRWRCWRLSPRAPWPAAACKYALLLPFLLFILLSQADILLLVLGVLFSVT